MMKISFSGSNEEINADIRSYLSGVTVKPKAQLELSFPEPNPVQVEPPKKRGRPSSATPKAAPKGKKTSPAEKQAELFDAEVETESFKASEDPSDEFDAAPEIDLPTLKDRAAKLIGALLNQRGGDFVRTTMNEEFGVTKLHLLPPEKYPAFITRIESLLID